MTDGAESGIATLTPAAERMRLYRDRRRKKLRCVTTLYDDNDEPCPF
jgi:hypothetical protein